MIAGIVNIIMCPCDGTAIQCAGLVIHAAEQARAHSTTRQQGAFKSDVGGSIFRRESLTGKVTAALRR